MKEHLTYIDLHKQTIKKAAKGNEAALFELYTAYAKAMFNSAYRIVGNKEDAEDVLQESFTKAFSRLHQYNHAASFGSWLKRIIINESISLIRRHKDVFSLDTYDIASEEPENNAIEYNIEHVIDALEQLPTGYRTVMSLFLLEGYDHQEISDILNISVSTSISQLSRGKKALRKRIENSIHHGQNRTVFSQK